MQEQIIAHEIDADEAPPQPLTVVEKVKAHLPPFEQKSHDLLLASIDQVAQHFVEQLEQLRANSRAAEQMVLEACTKARDDVTRLHLAGAGVMREVERGNCLCEHIADEVDRIMLG